MYLIGFPLLLIPFALYNIVAFLLNMSLDDKALTIPLLDERSDAQCVGYLSPRQGSRFIAPRGRAGHAA